MDRSYWAVTMEMTSKIDDPAFNNNETGIDGIIFERHTFGGKSSSYNYAKRMIKMMNENNYRDTKCKVIPTAKKTCTLAWSPNKVTFSGDYENEDNHISLMGFKME